MEKILRIFLLLVVVTLLSYLETHAQVYPAGFAQMLVSNGLANPTAMTFAPDGRIFVAEQAGRLRVIKNNTLLPAPFIQLNVSASGERGLIGIALDPDFSANNHIYLYYTVPGSPAHNRVSRFTANGDVVLPGSEVIILELDPLSNATNHNGGAMHFGKDGKLYVAIGENANAANAQNLDTYHGKLLRINNDGSVPDGNPFITGSEQRMRIWAYGLRNPYTFSIHPESGQILLNDVGQVTWEEINDASTGGKNFGWPTTEGKFNAATYPDLTNPIYAYPHGTGDGKGCAITGGTFFYPLVTNYPSSYWGKYFFQDLCNRWINTLDLTTAGRGTFATTIQGNSLALTVGNDGNLYYLSRSSGALYKIIYNNTTIPYITNQPLPLSVAEGQDATFTVSSLGTRPFEYQWQKDGVDISGATNADLIIDNTTTADKGSYRVIVSNEAGSTTSNTALLTVIANTLPIAEILMPVSGTTYTAGTSIAYSGIGNDAEDGAIPESGFRWEINFHHDSHTHDEPPVEGISSGIFSIPNEGETSDNVWYQIILTVTDSKGSEGKDTLDIFPNKSLISITTEPPGLEVTVDGQSVSTPVQLTSVEGMMRTFGVSSPQILENAFYEFESWSNEGDAIQTLATPADDLQLVANFSTVVSVEDDPYKDDVVFYPNPVRRGTITIEISLRRQQNVNIQVLNFLSQQISAQQRTFSAAKNTFPLDLGKQTKGIYTLLITMEDYTVVKKLLLTE